MRSSTRLAAGVVMLIGWLGSLVTASAEDQDTYREESAYGPIQEHIYKMDHEISIGWAYLPLDPYYKGYGAQLAYTIHFNPFIALELFRVGWSYNVDTELKTKIIDTAPEVSLAEFPAVVFFENTNLLFKLFYGKQSFTNRTVVHFEIFATLGAAFLFRNPYPIWEGDLDNARYEFGVNGGFGVRFWFNPTWSIRIDLRDTVTLLSLNQGVDDESWLDNSAMIGLSLAFNL